MARPRKPAPEDTAPLTAEDAVPAPEDAAAEAPAPDPLPTVDFPPAFERSLVLVLRHEGGFVDHPADPGGATNLGISLRYARTRGSLFDLDRDGDVDPDDIREITPETAAPAYFEDFWQAVSADRLPEGLAHAVFDAAVNSGPRRAIRWLQIAVGATPDGVIGPQTLGAVAETDETDAVERLCGERLAYMRTLGNWADFRRGWTRRVSEVIQESHKIARSLPL